jgi:hypothetical protein
MKTKSITKMLAFGFVLMASATGSFGNSAHAQSNSAKTIIPFGAPPSEPTEAFQNVKELHLYVCNYRGAEHLPNILKPKPLAQETLKYIKMWIDSDVNVGLAIKFADGKKHEPIVTTDQPCESLYDPAMEESGNLSLIVKVMPVLVGDHPNDTPPPLAILTGLLFRPDHYNSIGPLIRAKPQVIWNQQGDEKAIKQEINWNMGWRDDY